MEGSEKDTAPAGAFAKRNRMLWLKEGQVVVVSGPDSGRRFVFSPPRARIGKRLDNDIVLTDPTVSKSHLEIEEAPDGYILRDLKSRNGTYVNGSRIREIYLTPGASVVLGDTVLLFEPPAGKTQVDASSRDSFGGLRGASAPMRELYGLLERLSPSNLTVLIRGETGTGKEVVARALHAASGRANGPFVVFDCSAVSRDLVDSALFGHAAGSFTGATATRKGAFLSASGGTLFIDEIGELDQNLQPKLLSALERREILPIGMDTPVPVDVRVLAATHRDLASMVARGQFRHDLFYRLSVLKVVLPALRERLADIPHLVGHFIRLTGAGERRISPAALELLLRHPWPGNVRELKNVVDRAVLLAADDEVDVQHIELGEAPPGPLEGSAPGTRSLEDVEAAAISSTLERTGWNKSRAARILGIGRNTLQEKIDRYDIRKRGP